ncbi:hypothetical protein GDO81_018443 [Engystomops pustulosus]|uniref:Uncharacterized protein n=1 Tax=Engystomops pustulosus TaxID=76066 RepID=A0AAV6ZRN2_ENGPU|nr:hypothetical protein GDO81_018443 [Engystomops pustulosus]
MFSLIPWLERNLSSRIDTLNLTQPRCPSFNLSPPLIKSFPKLVLPLSVLTPPTAEWHRPPLATAHQGMCETLTRSAFSPGRADF